MNHNTSKESSASVESDFVKKKSKIDEYPVSSGKDDDHE